MWKESLPAHCPPADSELPASHQEFFRLVSGNPPTASDFDSQFEVLKKLGQKRKFADECIAKACSITTDPLRLQLVARFPLQVQRKLNTVVRVALTNDSGVIKQTGKDASHYSWWIKGSFDPVSASTLLGLIK
jgi:hypothetical protein